MDTDAAFLRSIEADLANPAPLLIYADWLEEHSQERLAHACRVSLQGSKKQND